MNLNDYIESYEAKCKGRIRRAKQLAHLTKGMDSDELNGLIEDERELVKKWNSGDLINEFIDDEELLSRALLRRMI